MSDRKSILIVGGAGYVGSHIAKILSKNGYFPVVLDDFSTGHREAVLDWPLVEGSFGNTQLVAKALRDYKVETVMHFGAKALVGESVKNPMLYYGANVADSLRLIEAMLQENVRNFVFSSTCATFGEPTERIHERLPQNPVNPYGRSKLFLEQILKDVCAVHDFSAVSLRYFNAAGADPDGQLGEDHRPETHLIPKILQVAFGQEKELTINGGDYRTADGTCIRDYVHVNDLAVAHMEAMKKISASRGYFDFNLGSETGSSNLEVVQSVEKVTGRKVPFKFGPRRPGDPPKLVADSAKAREELGWKTSFSLDETVRTAAKFFEKHPHGFTK